MVKCIHLAVLFLTLFFGLNTDIGAQGAMVTSDLWIRAVIQSIEKGPIEAVWKKGGSDETFGGDLVIWGYFYADPKDVTWGNANNPDIFVKIWFDRSGRLDVNFFHVSVPDIHVYSGYPYDGIYDNYGTTTLNKRYVRQSYLNGSSFQDISYEDGNSAVGMTTRGTPTLDRTNQGIFISAVIDTVEKGLIDAVWHLGGEDKTQGGHRVIWGYYHAAPEDVSWGSSDNPDAFVKIWFDAGGRTDVNFFHVSVPDIEVYAYLPFIDDTIKSGMTRMSNRYVRFEYPLTCSVEEKNRFVYRVMKGTYLWYDKVPDANPDDYPSPEALLNALKYEPLDRWSYITTTDAHYAYVREGRYVGLGIGFKYDREQNLRLSVVFKDSPAGRAGLKRTDKVLQINGMSINQIEENGLWDTIMGEDVPGTSVDLRIENSEGLINDLVLTKDWVAKDGVAVSDIITRNGAKVGYMVFDSFTSTAPEALDAVFAGFKQAQIDELVVDLRYNGGGYSYVAEHLGSLIGGKNTEGKVFESSIHNDRYSQWDHTTYFSHRENALDLERVIFITTRSTCSAAEMVMNSLNPFVKVVSIGETTCGKPVGMYGWDFCGMHIAPIEVKGVNAEGQGDYYDGIPATCQAVDDLTREFGDPLEVSLQTALDYIAVGSCTETTVRRLQEKQKQVPMNGFRKEIGAF